jgi:hypothetical protein
MVLRHGERKVEGVSKAWINGSQEFQFEAINAFLDFDVGDVYKSKISAFIYMFIDMFTLDTASNYSAIKKLKP